MDSAYDHIQEEIFASADEEAQKKGTTMLASADDPSGSTVQRSSLGTEFQETFRVLSDNPWGARLGGLWGSVRRQGENYYKEARQEYNAASEEAIKSISDLRNNIAQRTRGLSLSTEDGQNKTTTTEGGGGGAAAAARGGGGGRTVGDETPTTADKEKAKGEKDGPSFMSKVKAEASRRLKDFEKAEEAADEAILRFGSNITNFFKDAVSVAPPEEAKDGPSGKMLFESKDLDGKRVVHTSRFEAELHAIHCNLEQLSQDPASEEWPKWKAGFKVDEKTGDIAEDLDKYPELRRAMEILVPEKVDYSDFWARYYFLRHVIENEEKARREMLKHAADDEEEVGWDEESDTDTDIPKSKETTADTPKKDTHLKTVEARVSNDQRSQADSDASYDVVSAATSGGPASPKEKEAGPHPGTLPPNTDDSEEEDWE